MNKAKPYIPALRFRFLTPLYDPLLRWGMRELTFKRRLIQAARIASGFRVLDLGCGTGTPPSFSSKHILTQKSSA